MRFRIRRATIPADVRDQFELYGPNVVAQALASQLPVGGFGGPGANPTRALALVHKNQDAAAQWLREKRDLEEWRETRLEFVEMAILIFVALSVALELYGLSK